MKIIVIVRHAKAIEHDPEITDYERSLRIRGIKDAHKVSKHLKKSKIIPQLIISSPAFRAFETASIFASELDYSVKKIQIEDFLYEDYSSLDFFNMIYQCDPSVSTVLIVAHDPHISRMSAVLAKNFNVFLPTTGTAVLEFEAKSWSDIKESEGKLLKYWFAEKLD
ncbi:MAG: hypothetical protein A2275_12750 [Bacteroidetes bacterium RIFOXYA12_FULL_35_11]|nr:MAG: hypothetical protein A2X01_03140 [Bacteroidetes bacterium GWF2_35_48]OFY76503.1 MAG: hypothetical protein A2275_12750 [Bacteroidetes bacterium RIFOXYA12_FULL_35_11]OFY95826.1 MAG: hypothetical protein A2491_13575 [Bacteroidetes bacterium RIFOXYC12_FULL_35_7]HBX51417.1 hypothetical protein [Bacteroidales bacterium]